MAGNERRVFASALRRCACWLSQAGDVLVASAALATDGTQCLPEMPSVERVRSEVRGGSQADTLAQQAATLLALHQILEICTERPGAMSDPNSLPAGVRAAADQYAAAANAILSAPGAETAEVNGLAMRHSATPGYQDQVVSRFFSAAWATQFAASNARYFSAYSTPGGGDPRGIPGLEDMPMPGADPLDQIVQWLATGARVLGALGIAFLLYLRHFRRATAA
jgi:hypothetical protein